MPSFARIGTGVALRLIFAHLERCKGDCRGITLLTLLGDSREADRRGMKSLVSRRLHPDG